MQPYNIVEWYEKFIDYQPIKVDLKIIPKPVIDSTTAIGQTIKKLKKIGVEFTPRSNGCLEFIKNKGFLVAKISVIDDKEFNGIDGYEIDRKLYVEIYEEETSNQESDEIENNDIVALAAKMELLRNYIDECYFSIDHSSLKSLLFDPKYKNFTYCDDPIINSCYNIPSGLRDYLSTSLFKTKMLFPKKYWETIKDIQIAIANDEITEARLWLYFEPKEDIIYISPYLIRAVFLKIVSQNLSYVSEIRKIKTQIKIYGKNPLPHEEKLDVLNNKLNRVSKEFADIVLDTLHLAFVNHLAHELAHSFVSINPKFDEHICDCIAQHITDETGSNVIISDIVIKSLTWDSEDDLWGMSKQDRKNWSDRIENIPKYYLFKDYSQCEEINNKFLSKQ